MTAPDNQCQPKMETTPLPWSVGADGNTIMGNGGQYFVVYASASATCGREREDYYACRSARAEVRLSIKPSDAAFIVTACNSHAALTARVEALEVWSALEANCWDMRCIDIPTGAGDADIGWNVIEHHMAPPKERVVGTGNSPLEALRAALNTGEGEKS